MSRQERIVLDPAELATGGRAELDLHSGPIQVRESGVDWGQAEIEAFTAQHEMGESPVDYRLPNRVITIPLVLGAEGDYDAARIALQAKVSRINEEGGWLKRELIGGSYGEAGSHLFCDLVKATLKYGGSTFAARNGVDPDAELVLEALPDFYGDLIEESVFEGTGEASATFQVKGNLPGRVDLKVMEESANDQLGLAWGFRCRNYSNAATAQWTYEAEALTPLDTATEVTLTGASNKAVQHPSLGSQWTSILSTKLKSGGAHLTHKGFYEVWARVYTTSEELPWLRLVYSVGDTLETCENEPARVPGKGNFYLVSLGHLNLQEAPLGTHRWQGVIQGRGQVGGENVYVDRIWLVCADESSGVVAGRSGATSPISAKYLARDEFIQTAGAATGKSAAVGGTYSATPNSDPDDFEIDTVGRRLKRTAVSDTGTIGALPFKGRGIGVAAEATNLALRTDITIESSALYNLRVGHIVSYASNTSFLVVYLTYSVGLNAWLLRAIRAGGSGYGDNHKIRGFASSGLVTGTMVSVIRGNRLTVYCGGQGEELREELSVEDPMIGVKGKAFVYDENLGSGAATRYVDNFAMWVPDNDAAIFANRDARLTRAGAFRESADGLAFGPVARPCSDLPRIPVSGAEGRPVEVALKPSRGDFKTVPDSGRDKVAARLAYRPCFDYVPD